MHVYIYIFMYILMFGVLGEEGDYRANSREVFTTQKGEASKKLPYQHTV